MTFVTEEDLKKQNKLIKEYLNNRALLKNKLVREKLSKQQLQESASELFRPITKTFEKSQEKIDQRQDKLIEKLQKAIDNGEFTDEEKQFLKEYDLDTDMTALKQQGDDHINDLIDKTRNINQRLGGLRKGRNADKYLIDKQTNLIRKYRKKLFKLLEPTVGKGFSNDKLCERLHLLASAKQAGNNNIRLNQEILSILKKLKSNKCSSNCDFEKL